MRLHCTVKTKKIYECTCLRSHGSRVFSLKDKALVGNLENFYWIIAKGTVERNRPYVPEFISERLSRQQVADIRAYLQSLPQ